MTHNIADLSATFDLAPVSLWLEDFSRVAVLFAEWRAAGVTDLEAFLREDPERVAACVRAIKVIRVNARTVEMFEAKDEADLLSNLDKVFRDDMYETHIQELVPLWEGVTKFSSASVNYTLSGKRLDIQLNAVVLPGYETDLSQVLLTIDDCTPREDARRREVASRAYAEGIFEFSPVSLWVEDFSQIRRVLEDVRMRGITDLRTFTDVHPEFVTQCMSEIRVLNVNAATVSLFAAEDKVQLLANLHRVFRDAMYGNFREQLIELYDGKLFQQREVLNYALDGTERHLIMQFSVLPGHEKTWSEVLVALTDISARKKAEAYLEYLGKHDVLTGLYNRSFYVDEMNRLERMKTHPTALIALDLNALKETNDTMGHDAGDRLLRRVGEVLKEASDGIAKAARVGGDEFVILIPQAGEPEAAELVANIGKLIALNNKFYVGQELSVSMGYAARETGESMEALARRADALMYERKREFYAEIPRDRRAGGADS